MTYSTRPRAKVPGPRTTENPTLVKNMKHVKFHAIPPLSGPDSQGLKLKPKQVKIV